MVRTQTHNLHSDHLGSLRLITDDTGFAAKSSVYKPFGEVTDFTLDPTFTDETKGFIGEPGFNTLKVVDAKLTKYIPRQFDVASGHGYRVINAAAARRVNIGMRVPLDLRWQMVGVCKAVVRQGAGFHLRQDGYCFFGAKALCTGAAPYAPNGGR